MQVLLAPPPLCKCQNAAEMFDNSGMQMQILPALCGSSRINIKKR